MPTIHLGVYLTSGNETYKAVKWALEVRSASALPSYPADVQKLKINRLAIAGELQQSYRPLYNN